MTDDSTDGDRSVDATTDFDTRPLAPSLLTVVAALQQARGIPVESPFVVINVRPDGLRVGLADPRLEAVIGERAAPGIRPETLDQLLADHLVRTGRVAEPTTDEWTAELLELAERARTRLSASDATFIMGREHVRFFRVAQRDLDEATDSLIDQVARLCDEVAADATEPVTSLVLAPGHELWPGLSTALATTVALPVVSIGPSVPGSDARPRTRREAPGDEVTGSVPRAVTEAPSADSMGPALRDPEHDAEPVAVGPVAQPTQSGDFPAAWIDDVITPITEPIAVVTAAHDRGGAPANDPGAAETYPQSVNIASDDAALDDPYLLDAPATLDDPAPRTVVDAGPPPGGYDPREWAFGPTGGERPVPGRDTGPRIPKRLLAAAGAGVVAVIAVTVAFTITGDEPEERSATSSAATQTVADEPSPEYADPADVVDAGVAAARYTPPPPPPPPTTTSEPTQQQQNQPRPRPRPRQRVIPNPIPGLPPIILPG